MAVKPGRLTERLNLSARDLEAKSTLQTVRIIQREDAKVPGAIKRVLPQIARAVDLIVERLARGGRLIYLGAGTSGRLGVLDAVECQPTFGTDCVRAIIAGGPQAMVRSMEGAEDDPRLAVGDLRHIRLTSRDALVGISASGQTPYTLAGMRYGKHLGCVVIGLACNRETPMRELSEVTITPIVGPEVIAGSTRMKAGTAQKLVLNMLSTASMVRLGRVLSGRMINVQATNLKLRRRACDILTRAARVSPQEASRALRRAGNKLPVALLMLWREFTRREAESALKQGPSVAAVLRSAEKEWRLARGAPKRKRP